MTITDIADISKTKVKVCIDNDETFALYKSELRIFGIKQGEELSEELYHKLMDEILLKRAKLRCMNLLKSRDYTEHQLRTKLKQGIYPERIIESAVAYVISYGYVNDVAYAKSYIGYTGSTKSRRQIETALLGKGISKENIAQAYEQCAETESFANEEEIIEKLLAKKHYDSLTATCEERQKIVGFLYRKGFSLDKIYKAVGKTDS